MRLFLFSTCRVSAIRFHASARFCVEKDLTCNRVLYMTGVSFALKPCGLLVTDSSEQMGTGDVPCGN